MISPQALEEAVLALLCFHPELSLKIAPRIDTDKIFTSNRTNQKIAKEALKYITDYTNCPGIALQYLLENDIEKGGEEGKLLGKRIEFLAKRVIEIDATFVMDQFDRFIETQTLQNNFQRAIELLETGDLEQAKKEAFKLDKKTDESDPAINLTDPKSLYVLDKVETDDYFSCGISAFDKRGIRLGRKMLCIMLAPKGTGKSWWLVEVGKGGIQHHHKVLHITLELSAEKTYLRYLQSLFALTRREVETVRIPIFHRDEMGAFISMEIGEMIRDPIFSKREEIRRKLEMMYRSHLIIKFFTTGQLTVENLRIYLEQLKREEGFIPDIISIDYADLMFVNKADYRIDVGRLYVDLRAIGIDYNAVLATATQSNREGAEAKQVRSTNVAEDWSKIMTADLVFTLSKTPQEILMGLARVLVAHARDEEDKMMALITQSYRIGQFCLDSVMMNANVSQILGNATGQGNGST